VGKYSPVVGLKCLYYFCLLITCAFSCLFFYSLLIIQYFTRLLLCHLIVILAHVFSLVCKRYLQSSNNIDADSVVVNGMNAWLLRTCRMCRDNSPYL
jgi:glucan phosphoethanolaminetransferase (alkaline phosphatase superfamily)